MARLHRADRYNRATDDSKVTGHPAQTVEHYIAGHPELFSPNTGMTDADSSCRAGGGVRRFIQQAAGL